MGMGGAARPAFAALVLCQVMGALADNALLLAALGLLADRATAAWTAPALRVAYFLPCLVLAAWAGAVADAFAKPRVMLAALVLKLAGCALLLAGLHPVLAFGLMGLGAAPYGASRYGILPELLAPGELVGANAWIEGSTVLAILGGAGLGGWLLQRAHGWPRMDTPAMSATACVALLYALAVLAAALMPGRRPAAAHVAVSGPLWPRFLAAARLLRQDRQACLAMAVTCLFWAIAAALQFIVLRWAVDVLGLRLAEAAWLQVALGGGIIAGAVAAARLVGLADCRRLLPLGLAIGVLVALMLLVKDVFVTAAMLVAIGALSGMLLVPMNALLQARGSLLMPAGQSVAVQNFYENLAAVLALAGYGALTLLGMPLAAIIGGFAMLIVLATLALIGFERARGAARPA